VTGTTKWVLTDLGADVLRQPRTVAEAIDRADRRRNVPVLTPAGLAAVAEQNRAVLTARNGQGDAA
jgi:hypothetical protein